MLTQMYVGLAMACTHDHVLWVKCIPPMFPPAAHKSTLNTPSHVSRLKQQPSAPSIRSFSRGVNRDDRPTPPSPPWERIRAMTVRPLLKLPLAIAVTVLVVATSMRLSGQSPADDGRAPQGFLILVPVREMSDVEASVIVAQGDGSEPGAPNNRSRTCGSIPARTSSVSIRPSGRSSGAATRPRTTPALSS